MKFIIDTGKVKTRELVEAENSLSGTLRLMAKFMVNEDTGEPVKYEEAYDLLMDLDMDDQLDVQGQFMDAFIPKVKRRRS